MSTATVVDRPILFSGAMVKAILAGRKTQTRRVAKVPDWTDGIVVKSVEGVTWLDACGRHPGLGGCVKAVWCPYGQPGDRLWVRETWSPDHAAFYPNFPVVYAADNGVDVENGQAFSPEANASFPFRWRPSIHMPRRHSRITLEITEVRVQRLQGISELDCEAELGVEPYSLGDGAYGRFRDLWQSINGKRPGCDWRSNCWVWAISFRRLATP